MAPWSQCPTHQIFLFEDCSVGALHCEHWCFLGIGTSDTYGELLGVFIHHWPEEPALPDFGLCAEYSVMASIRCCMASFNDLHPLRRWHTPP
jgi:hypothetical protein